MIKNYTFEQSVEAAVTDLVNQCRDFNRLDIFLWIATKRNNESIYITDLPEYSYDVMDIIENYMKNEFAPEAPRYGYITGPDNEGRTQALLASEDGTNPFQEVIDEEEEGLEEYKPLHYVDYESESPWIKVVTK